MSALDHNQTIEEIILGIEREVFAAIQQKDVESFGRFLAEEFIHRSPDGAELNKEDFLKGIAALPVNVRSVRGEHQRVSVFGEVAVLTGVQRAEWELGEEKGLSSGAFTDVFVRRGDEWLMVLAYSVDLPD